LGGLKLGLCKVAYQVGIAEVVKREPTMPANCGKAREIIRRL